MSRILNEIKENINNVKVFPSVTITPNIATELLKLNTANRPIKDAKVKEYAKRMTEGKWLFNGENIVISRSGKLQNGQKRCLAIIESGMSQVYNIQTGIQDRAFDTMDDGQPRSAGDALAILGYNNTASLSGMIRIIMVHERVGLAKSRVGGSKVKISNTEMVEWMTEHDTDYVVFLHQNANRIYRYSKLMTTSTLGGLLYILAKEDRRDLDKTIRFFEKVYSGEDISMSNYPSIYLLREKLIQWKTASFDIDNTVKYANIIKAWNIFKAGGTTRRLAWSNVEDFPVVK